MPSSALIHFARPLKLLRFFSTRSSILANPTLTAQFPPAMHERSPAAPCSFELNRRSGMAVAVAATANRLGRCFVRCPSGSGGGGCKCMATSSSSSGFRSDGSEGLLSGGGDPRSSSDLRPSSEPMPSEEEKPPTELFTLPTTLTLARVAAVPLLVSTFYVDTQWGTTATTSIFIAASITDWLDGYLARKMKLGTAFGAFLDPVADKLMVAAVLVLLCSRPLEIGILGQFPWLMTAPAIAIIGREITMSAVREWAASKDRKLLEAVAVNKLGKWKTTTQMTALTILLATRDSNLGGAELVVASGVVLLYTSAGLALWSLFVYMKKISKVLLK